MPRSESIGNISDLQGNQTPKEMNTDIETRLTNLERTISLVLSEIADINQRLDIQRQPKAPSKKDKKQKGKPSGSKDKKPKRTPPSEIITALLKKKPHSRAEIESETGMDTEAVRKCVGWMIKQDLIEKITEQDNNGNSRWRLTQ